MSSFDYAIHGTGPFPGLLAGLLARDHGKTVVLVGRRPSAQRLPRSLHLAMLMATRPESWRLLRGAESETRALLASIGAPEAISTGEMSIIGDSPATLAALDHIAHLAHGFGHQVRRLGSGWSFRLVATLQPDSLQDKLATWLTALGVQLLDEAIPGASQTILADDSALFDLPEDQRPPQLIAEAMTATLVVAPRPLPAPVQSFPDRGVTLAQRPGNAVLALVSGERDVDARLASTLTGPFPLKRLATTRYRRIVTADGAPLIGRIKPGKTFLIAGLGDAAAFMAPALARFLAGQSGADEKRWFASHDPARPRDAIAEFVA